jgi:hypothetical protein
MATTPQGGRIVRIRAIVLGAIAALAMATLTATANAGTSSTHRVSGSLASLVAATTTVTKTADREVEAAAARATARIKATESAQKPIVAIKSAAPSALQVSATCQQAIDALKAMRQADAAEDTAEKAQPQSATATAADRAEDLADAQQWKQALTAVRTACLPQPTAACEAALAALKALVPANLPEGWRAAIKSPNQIDLAGARAAFAAVKAACGTRD